MTDPDRATTESIPGLKRAGIDHVIAAAELGLAIQATRTVTLSGPPPYAITFASLVSKAGRSIKAPADRDYLVFVSGNSDARLDLTTRTRDGFSLAGGADGESVELLILGMIGGMVR